MDIENAYKLLVKIALADNILKNEPMSAHTTIQAGGPADIFVTPYDTDNAIEIIDLCKENGFPYFVIGRGSNVIVRDGGLRGVVISTTERMKSIKVSGTLIEVEAGALLSKIANTALESNLTGFEFASGIPGSAGGAVTMNAGAYGRQMEDVVLNSTAIDNMGNVIIMQNKEHKFSHRNSIFQQPGWIVLKTVFKLEKGDGTEIKAKMDELNQSRKEKQPLEMPSAGSVFKRPAGNFAGKLIEDCGLKGYSIGGAQISERHAGFIINRCSATASDIISLISYVQQTVLEKTGVQLVPEVKILGD